MLKATCNLRDIGRLDLLKLPRHQWELKPSELSFAPDSILNLSTASLLHVILLAHIDLLNI